MPLLPLTRVRAAAAAALAPATDADPVVHSAMVDMVTPPALVLAWEDPWLTLSTIAGGYGMFQAQLSVWCFANRIEPESGIEVLETLATYTVGRLAADTENDWSLSGAQAPLRFDYSGLHQLGVRLDFTIPVSMNGGQ